MANTVRQERREQLLVWLCDGPLEFTELEAMALDCRHVRFNRWEFKEELAELQRRGLVDSTHFQLLDPEGLWGLTDPGRAYIEPAAVRIRRAAGR